MGKLQVEVWEGLKKYFMNIGLIPTETLEGINNQEIINW